MKQPLVIIKAGSATPAVAKKYGDFETWLQQGLAFATSETKVVRAAENEALPHPAGCGGVVITGSHAMVTDEEPWSVAVAAWIPAVIAAGIPLLGVCYGHQLLAVAMGGKVGYHPGGREVGTVTIELHPAGRRDPLFSGLPPSFPAQVLHAQTVLSLPPGAVLLAGNPFEPHHAFHLGPSAWGLQFHPEYSAEIMRAELTCGEPLLTAAGLNPATLASAVQETPEASTILRRFGAIVRGKSH